MSDRDQEAQREQRRIRANQIRIKASEVLLPESEFNKRYVERHIIASIQLITEIENTTQTMICRECIEPYRDVFAANVFYVTIEDDPLGNYWKMATLKCFFCGFFEHVVFDKPLLNTTKVMPKGKFAEAMQKPQSLDGYQREMFDAMMKTIWKP